MAERRPIGYWLKELDRLVTARFEEDLAAGDLSRRQWQMLNSLAEGPRPAGEVRDGLAPFWTEAGEWDAQLARLVERGLVVEDSGKLSLTDVGRATHDDAFARIGRRRRAMVEGITDEQYLETVRILEKMAANMAAE
ncbi:MarR family winged helix-turn-helix transcriptional regulator [Nocardia sp. KC 131]|uniref:MarR family winged helix-turn-helix transcriptional regulator n=1 Tax=Nocardia arseniciresistens TaxID=3392119 RepID=UPI00398ECDCD